MKLNVLSVDWDYFFPCIEYFNWGHSEQRNSIFAETVWQPRAAQNLYQSTFPRQEQFKGSELTIHDYLRPDKKLLCGFWLKASEIDPIKVVACESHFDMYEIFNDSIDDLTVYNFDVHHDCGYDNGNSPHCGNWVKHLKQISDYHLIYPDWRRDWPESCKPPEFCKVHYRIPESMPPFFEYIFICRSSSWTPPWCDSDWLSFIEHWRHNPIVDFVAVEYVLKERPFDYESSKQMEIQMQSLIKEAQNAIST